ncbi:MAG TPA: PilN domain-containing protein [Terriglobia bacterium]|nr:PilN domain-containing protein [Terriglobia bacterium]
MIRVNLLGEAKRKKRRAAAPLVAPGAGLMLALLVVLLVAVAGVQWYRYGQLQEQGRQLDLEVARLTAEKAELAQVQAQYETFSRRKELLQARINIIEQLKAQQSGPVILLNTLASSVSATESLWLTGFVKTGTNISVTGMALSMRAVADFITRLKNSNTFRDVNLRETVQETARDSQNFTFTVEAQVEPPTPLPAAGGAA